MLGFGRNKPNVHPHVPLIAALCVIGGLAFNISALKQESEMLDKELLQRLRNVAHQIRTTGGATSVAAQLGTRDPETELRWKKLVEASIEEPKKPPAPPKSSTPTYL